MRELLDDLTAFVAGVGNGVLGVMSELVALIVDGIKKLLRIESPSLMLLRDPRNDLSELPSAYAAWADGPGELADESEPESISAEAVVDEGEGQ